ncbi:MAG: hypothetical protein ACOC0P_01785, partial [Planctomycetota bacterium]
EMAGDPASALLLLGLGVVIAVLWLSTGRVVSSGHGPIVTGNDGVAGSDSAQASASIGSPNMMIAPVAPPPFPPNHGSNLIEQWDGVEAPTGAAPPTLPPHVDADGTTDEIKVRVFKNDLLKHTVPVAGSDLWSFRNSMSEGEFDDLLDHWSDVMAETRFRHVKDADEDLEDILEFFIDEPRGFVVVNDHPDRQSEHLQSIVRMHEDGLAAMGLHKVSGPDYEARVRHVVGQHITTPYLRQGQDLNQAEYAVGELLGDALAEVGCVLWLYPVSSNSAATGVWVTVPGSVDSKVDDKMVRLLQARARNN